MPGHSDNAIYLHLCYYMYVHFDQAIRRYDLNTQNYRSNTQDDNYNLMELRYNALENKQLLYHTDHLKYKKTLSHLWELWVLHNGYPHTLFHSNTVHMSYKAIRQCLDQMEVLVLQERRHHLNIIYLKYTAHLNCKVSPAD